MNYKRNRVGRSDLEVFPLALGGNTFGWTSDEGTSRQVLDEYLEAGGNIVDTADTYSAWVPGHGGGESEIILGRWMAVRNNRDQVVVVSKVSQHPQFPGLSASNIEAAANESLLRLGTDYIDLYYAHFDDPKTPIEESAEAFDKLVKTGKVRAIGLSNYSAERIEEWFRVSRENNLTLPVALEPQYNLVSRDNYEHHLLPVARKEQLAVFPYFSLAAGFLTGKYRSKADANGKARQGMVADYLTADGFSLLDTLEHIAKAHGVQIASVSLAWLRNRPFITAPIASARVPEQLSALLVSIDLDLSDGEMEQLDRASQSFAQTN